LDNSKSLEDSDTEDEAPFQIEKDARSRGASQILHGAKEFTANRFFDKAIQVVLGDNGIWGINCEHSIAEALPHGFMNDFIYKSM
jgi:hypothetical protein